MDDQNYLMLNGVKIELTPEQLEQLKSGIKQPVDFSEYNENDWFYYKLDNNTEWLSKNAFEDDHSFVFSDKKLYTKGVLCHRDQVSEFRRPTEEEMGILYKHHPQYKPKPQWEDFGEIKGYYIHANSCIIPYKSIAQTGNKNTFPTKEEAEACLALSQLLQWRDRYNEGWKPDWSESDIKYIILFSDNSCCVDFSCCTSYVLSFKTQKIRDKFREDFKDLIEIAKPLL